MASEPDPGDALTRVSLLVQATLERRAREQGISLIQARLLTSLRDRAPTISELAQLLDLDKSSTSGLVDRAQRRGLLRRVPSQVDRRAVRVRLSHRGLAVVQSLSAAFAQDLDAMLEPLSADERHVLTGYLDRVSAAGETSD